MKKKRLFILLFLFSFSLANAQEKKEKRVRFGFSGGVNSAMYTVDKLILNDEDISRPENNYKLGYKFTLLSRIRLAKKHFIQPEITYQQSKCEIQFDNTGTNSHAVNTNYIHINNRIRTFEAPIMYGYNFVNTYPYSASLMIGGMAKYSVTKKSELNFTNVSVKEKIKEELYPLNYSLVAGLHIMISKVFFDFRVEKGLTNISKEVLIPAGSEIMTEDQTTELKSMTFKRTCESVSFTIGYMF